MPQDTIRPEESRNLVNNNNNHDGGFSAEVLNQFWSSRLGNDGAGINPFGAKTLISGKAIADNLKDLYKNVCTELGFGACDLFDSKENAEKR